MAEPIDRLSNDVKAVDSNVRSLEMRVRKLEKKMKEQEAFFKKLKKNARLFFQRLRSQLDFKF